MGSLDILPWSEKLTEMSSATCVKGWTYSESLQEWEQAVGDRAKEVPIRNHFVQTSLLTPGRGGRNRRELVSCPGQVKLAPFENTGEDS